ncbi:type VII secretion integral membrane protein EccD [Mycobacterium sp. CBMA293]|nr:type VII secretion integral membrane protein EccD [Mycolicibacterium sp. CBMA 360]MUL61988.1 type VII secretion integral membrane protein EccD [Mycolicibacterium sp. CBMA 335]MUL73263.1 type VII secretion integral membrane protein EccD [Mycolicibacterium sp. CBMA 311]MUL96432.1 type VII secretion integral membrane protein EccD [Mycolicibacterium sp. CBMA 230]MUM14530.1 type VII secretion integral membrane protein EccD [Mycolicibacterium sp. CBMA 293]
MSPAAGRTAGGRTTLVNSIELSDGPGRCLVPSIFVSGRGSTNSYRESGHIDPGGAMSESKRRLSVQSDGDQITDLVLPAGAAVDSLLPDIVALAHPQGPAAGRGWHLSRLAGHPIDGSLSLVQNDIHDGDILQLQQGSVPELGLVRAHTVTMAAGHPLPDQPGPRVGITLVVWAVVIGAAMLMWSTTHGNQPATVAISCGSALVALLAALRTGHPEWVAAAVLLSFTTGFCVVPDGPSAPNVLLGAAATLTTALVLLRNGGHLITIAATTFSVPVVVVAGLASYVSLPLGNVGAAIAAAALVVLSAAPRCAVMLAGLTPDSATVADGDAQRIELAHRVLTGMVIGASAAIALGTGAVAVGAVQRAGVATVVFSWVLAAAVLLRAPSYRLPPRRWCALITGMACTTAALAVTAMALPEQVTWLSVAVIAIILGVNRIGPMSAAAAQRLAYAEYLALAAVPPSALWAADIFSLVRDW